MIDEFLALAYYQEFGLQAIVCRFFNTIGVRQTGEYGMVVPRFVRKALRNQPIEIYGTGNQSRCFCNVADVVRALTRLLDCEQALGEVINLGSNEPITINALAAKVVSMTGSASELRYLSYDKAYGQPFDDMLSRMPDLTKAQRLIGFQAQYALEETLQQVIGFERLRLGDSPQPEPRAGPAAALSSAGGYCSSWGPGCGQPPLSSMNLMMSKTEFSVVHVFPYSAAVSGGHSNAIRGFISCQRAKQINAVGIAPKPDTAVPPPSWEFPLAEVDSLWDLRWAAIAEEFSIAPVNSVIQFYSVNSRFAPLLRDLRRAGVPYVLNSQGALNFHGVAHWFKKFVYLNFVDRGPRKAAGVQVLTTVAERNLRLLMPGYRGLRLVQGNLFQLPRVADLPAGSRSEFGVPQDAFLLAFLGRLDLWVKGLDVLVEAFSSLPSERFRLVLAGPDWEGGKSKLEHLGEQFGCGNRIHFVGPVYGARKWSLLRTADLFVSPSRWEAFGIALVEAMAMGLPLVSSNQISLAPQLHQAGAALTRPALGPATCPSDRHIGGRPPASARAGDAWQNLGGGTL